MVDAGAREVEESVILDALDTAHKEIRRICDLQKQLRGDAGKEKISVASEARFTQEIFNDLMTRYRTQLRETLLTQGKKARGNAVKDLETSIVAGIPAEETERIEATRAAFQEMETSVFRDVVVQEQTRLDGRSFKEIRPITINLAALPRTHGEGKSSKAPRKRGALFWATLTSLLSPTIVDWVQIQSASRIVLCSRISS